MNFEYFCRTHAIILDFCSRNFQQWYQDAAIRAWKKSAPRRKNGQTFPFSKMDYHKRSKNSNWKVNHKSIPRIEYCLKHRNIDKISLYCFKNLQYLILLSKSPQQKTRRRRGREEFKKKARGWISYFSQYLGKYWEKSQVWVLYPE